MSQRGKYFIPGPANTSSHLISVKTRLRSSLLFAFKLEAAQGSRNHPGTRHKSMSSPARGLCRGAAPAFQMERENSSGSLDCARQGAAPAGVTSGKSRARKGIWGCCLFACGRSSGSCWRSGYTSMAVPAVLQQSHGLCLCWDGRLREAGWESCGSFCFSSERETHCAAGEAGRASPFPLH